MTQDRIIIDGYARWELAKLRNIATVLCLEYRLTEDEALCFMLRKQQRSNGSNAFTRILLALDLEPSLRGKARLNQQVGGRDKGSSMLTTVDRIDTRKEIARLAEVSLGNVTKAKRILSHGCLDLQNAARNGEISIHKAEQWSRYSPSEQLERLRVRRIQRGIRQKARNLVAGHVKALRPQDLNPNSAECLALLRQLVAMPHDKFDALETIVIGSIAVPGKGIFVTKDLFQALQMTRALTNQ